MPVRSSLPVAPGARVIVRDAEWLVRSTRRASNGAQVFEAIAISDFMQGRQAQFIADLEDDLRILKPEETGLVQDDSPGYRKSLLFVEGHLRQTAPTDSSLYVGHQAAMDVLPFQLDPTLKALKMPRQRLLIADAVGLGKTLEAGILTAELMRRGRARRILVVTTKSMLTQFQKEFWVRFTIPLTRLDSVGLQRIRAKIPTNHNPFHYYDKSIVSVDTLKQDREYRTYIEQAHWDVIIIDECHNVARRGRERRASLRSRLADRLATRSDTLIMLSATPHDGRPESFASLMNMLDPTAIANESEYTKEDIRDLYVRRFKKDVKDQLDKNFPERQVQGIDAEASAAEERAFEVLSELKLGQSDSKRKAGMLFKTTLLKALLSSPMACLQTVRNRIKTLTKKEGNYAQDIAELEKLEASVEAIALTDFSKYQQLLQLITGKAKDGGFAWKGKDKADRLVIFTERIETMKFLATQLQEDLGLKDGAVAMMDGSMADVEQMAIIEKFGNEKEKLRLLVCTDVASEGINLHYLSHRLVHFDIPWSLMALQQRNGRIDRYGQEQQPQIRYLLTRSRNPRMDEAERIIRVLLKKDEQAVQNIGDPSVFMGVFDVTEEELITAQAIESGESAESFDERLTPESSTAADDFDPFAWFDQEPEVSQDVEAEAATAQWSSLFANDYIYTAEALRSIEEELGLQINCLDDEQRIELTMPPELLQRFDRLPKEVKPQKDKALILSARKQDIAEALEESRRSEETWPDVQYLWPLHPLLGWLGDRCITTFRRHEAPVLTLPQLAKGEALFVMSGVIPNRQGQPLVNHWLTVVFQNGKVSRVEDFEQTLARTKLGKQQIPNAMQPVSEQLLDLRAEAVEQARQTLLQKRQEFVDRFAGELAEQRQRLKALRDRHYEQLELTLSRETKRSKTQAEKKRETTACKIEEVFQAQERWIEDAMTTEPSPFIKLICVLRGDKS